MSDRDDLLELFHRAGGMADEERSRFLSDLEQVDAEAAAELRSLLEASGRAASYFERLGAAVPSLLDQPSAVAEVEDPRIGSTVGPYTITERIGVGGMGVVYRARHERLGRDAALKFLPAEQVADPEAKRRLVREARAAGALEHANLCTLFDVGEAPDGDLYLAMAYYEGETLKQRLSRGPLRFQDALAIAEQVADGLAEAHRMGVVHRDVKPANVMLTPDGRVKLLDFGVALVDRERMAGRPGQAAYGSVAYMAPEQANGEPGEARTDVWAVGVLLYEMLAGERPFTGHDTETVLRAILHENPVALEWLLPDLPLAVSDIVRRCLARDPDGRYQTAAALLADLHHATRTLATPGSRAEGRRSVPSGLRAAPCRVYLSYCRGSERDERLARSIQASLSGTHHVFVDHGGRVGPTWAETIDTELRRADVLLVLLSPEALGSEMVLAEVETAFRSASFGDGPRLLVLRMPEGGLLPAPFDAYLEGIPETTWNGEADTARTLDDLRVLMEDRRALSRPPAGSGARRRGGSFRIASSLAAVPVEAPEGTMDPESRFYVTREADRVAMETIPGNGVTITIKGPRQMGKSSLLIRLARRAIEAGKRVVYLDFQRMGSATLAAADRFYPALCQAIALELELEPGVEDAWKRPLSAEQRCTLVMERTILKAVDAPVLLAMDEVDRMFDSPFRSDFFGMLRSWHNDRAIKPVFRRLDLALVTSTEPYELIEDLNQSPFNVGEVIQLADFTIGQVADLNERHGGPLAPDHLERLFDLVGGHPYLTRKALFLVATRRWSAEALLSAADTEDGPFGDHLRHHLFRLSMGDRLVGAMRQILNDGTCASERDYWRLRGAGLVVRRAGRIAPRCGLYAEFLGRHL